MNHHLCKRESLKTLCTTNGFVQSLKSGGDSFFETQSYVPPMNFRQDTRSKSDFVFIARCINIDQNEKGGGSIPLNAVNESL